MSHEDKIHLKTHRQGSAGTADSQNTSLPSPSLLSSRFWQASQSPICLSDRHIVPRAGQVQPSFPKVLSSTRIYLTPRLDGHFAVVKAVLIIKKDCT